MEFYLKGVCRVNIWRRFAPQFAVLGVVCLIAAIGIVKKDIIGVNADADTRQTVIIDAGHGELVNTTDWFETCRENSI